MPTKNADCAMCANWQQDYCKQTYGRCPWQEEQAMEGVHQGGGPKPEWIECWMKQDADASHCEGFQITVQGQRELDIINADSTPDPAGRPVVDREWAAKAVGVGGAR